MQLAGADAAGLFASWDPARLAELASGPPGGLVGTVFVSETEQVRVWHLSLAPGERLPFHRHVLDYFWTVLSDGRARSHYADGTVREVTYRSGDTRHFAFSPGQDMVHDLENTGTGPLCHRRVQGRQQRAAAVGGRPMRPGRRRPGSCRCRVRVA